MAEESRDTPAQAAARPLLNRFFGIVTAPDRWHREYEFQWPNHVDRARYILEPWRALSGPERKTLITCFPDHLANDEHVDSTSRAACHAAIQAEMGIADPVPWTLRAYYGQVYGNLDPARARVAVAHIVYPDDEVDQVEAFDVLRQSLVPVSTAEAERPDQAAIIIKLPLVEEGIRELADGSTYIPAEESIYYPVYDFLAAMATGAPGTKLVLSTLERHRETWRDVDASLKPLGAAMNTFNLQRLEQGLPAIRYAPAMSRLAGIPPDRGAPNPVYLNQRVPRPPSPFDRWRNPVTGQRGAYRSITPGMN